MHGKIMRKIPREVVEKVIMECVGTRGVAVLGSFARGEKFVGDIDLLVIGGTSIDFRCPHVRMSGGQKKATYIVSPKAAKGGSIHVDVYFLPREQRDSFAFMMLMLIGPAEENIKLRILAKKRGLKMNQYGFMLPNGKYMKTKFPTIKSIYDFLGMERYINHQIFLK